MARKRTKAAAKPPAAPEKPAEKLAPKPKSKRKPAAKKAPAKAAVPTVVVTANGSNVMGVPIFVDPRTSADILNNLVCRELTDPSGPLDPISPTVTGLQETVRAMSAGENLAPYRESIQRIASSQPEKGDVIRSYLNQIDHEIIADLTVMRANSIRVIKRATARHDVSVSEALVVWRMCNEQLPELKKGLTDSEKSVDTTTVIEKIDYQKQQVERTVQKRWEGTTPQGRELIRKKLWEIKREMLAKAGINPPSADDKVEAAASP